MADAYADTLILGGGVAGLAAADVLSARAPHSLILLLEGRDRLGGRIETRHDPAWPLPIEHGAEFIHGKPRETWDIVRAGGCCLYDVTNEHWVFERGRLQKPGDFAAESGEVLELIAKHAAHLRKRDLSYDTFIAQHGKGIPPKVRQWARLFVEGFNAADAREVSAAWLARTQKASDEIEGDRLFRVYAGYDKIVQFLHTGLGENVRVETDTVVTRITWRPADAGSDSSVLVHTQAPDGTNPRTFEAKRAVVTFPLGVLQASVAGDPTAPQFDPPLPEQKRAAIAQLRMGAVVKVILRFKEPFWEKIAPELDFVHSAALPFPTWWTTLPIRSTMLTAWAGGPAADALAGKPTNQILDTALGTLARLLKVPRRTVGAQLANNGAHVADWRGDPFARGAYSYAAVGGDAAARALSRPIARTLYFAGEATHPDMPGTVAGALTTGRRAATEIP